LSINQLIYKKTMSLRQTRQAYPVDELDSEMKILRLKDRLCY